LESFAVVVSIEASFSLLRSGKKRAAIVKKECLTLGSLPGFVMD